MLYLGCCFLPPTFLLLLVFVCRTGLFPSAAVSLITNKLKRSGFIHSNTPNVLANETDTTLLKAVLVAYLQKSGRYCSNQMCLGFTGCDSQTSVIKSLDHNETISKDAYIAFCLFSVVLSIDLPAGTIIQKVDCDGTHVWTSCVYTCQTQIQGCWMTRLILLLFIFCI